MTYPTRFAPTPELERELLIHLDFVPAAFKAAWRDMKWMTADNIRAVIRQRWPAELAALEAKVSAPPTKLKLAASPAVAPRVPAAPVMLADQQPAAERAEDARRIAEAFGLRSAEGGVKFDQRSQVQTFTFKP